MPGIAGATGESQVGDSRDAGQRLAAKTHACNALEIVECGDLARGVTGERKPELLFADAVAVVADLEQLDAAAGELHADVMRAGVEAVLQQFLEGRGRPLHYLARGDLVDQQVRQNANRSHGKL